MKAAFDAALDAVEVGGARAAAWTLHGFHVSDRAWALSQLDDAQRMAVEPLLAELTELGATRALDTPQRHPVADDLGALTRAGPEAMAKLLATEPITLIRQVVALADWSWVAGVRKILSDQGIDIGDAQSTDKPTLKISESLRQVLLMGLAARLKATEGSVEEGRRNRWRARLVWRRQ